MQTLAPSFVLDRTFFGPHPYFTRRTEILRSSIAVVKSDADFPLAMEKTTNICYFVVYGPNCFHAIEVKNAAKVTRRDAAGLESFHDDYPEATCTLLYRGTDALKVSEHCTALPVEQFLRQVIPNAPLPPSTI